MHLEYLLHLLDLGYLLHLEYLLHLFILMLLITLWNGRVYCTVMQENWAIIRSLQCFPTRLLATCMNFMPSAMPHTDSLRSQMTGAILMCMESSTYLKPPQVAHLPLNKKALGLKRHSCAFVSVLEEYSGPRLPGE